MSPAASPSSDPPRQWLNRWGAPLALLLGVFAVYANSLQGPFLLDDIPAIERNSSIRQLWPLSVPLAPPADGSGVSGRPLANLSLALNFAVGGLDVRGYHGTNVGLHALCVLTLWAVLRHTLRRVGTGTGAEAVAFGTALLWGLHPLQTESVVCVVQRNEILGALAILGTLYGFIRGMESTRCQAAWLVASVFACLAGIACKETVVVVPILVLLYDRTFDARSFQTAWRLRAGYYAALFATWIPLAWLVWENRQRGGTAGFGAGVGSWDYLLTQCRALMLYMKLAVWPHPLVVDYGWPVVHHLADVWRQGVVIVGALGVTVVLLLQRPAWGFLGAAFFLLLAPSSSVVPLVTQTIAEHRMYLPLAVVLLALALAAARMGRPAVVLLVAAAFGLGSMTIARNRDYRSELVLWTDTVTHAPENPRAHGNLGRTYLALSRWEEALAECRQEVRLDPDYNGDGRINAGRALVELGRPAEALPWFDEGLRMRPNSFDAHNNYGIALAALNHWEEAAAHYRRALQLRADAAAVHNNLGNALAALGRVDEAMTYYAAALRVEPEFDEAETNWARTLARTGHLPEALPHFEAVVRRHPSAATHTDLAVALGAAGRVADALPHLEAAARLEPDSADAHFRLAVALGQLGRSREALEQDEAALRLRPDFDEARAHREWLQQR